MGIFIESFSVTPQNITPARVTFTVNYKGYVDANADNPVAITLTLENGTNVYVAETATSAEKKSYSWTDNFPLTNAGGLSKGIFIGIDPADAGKTCTVNVHFQPASGGPGDDEQTHVNF